MSIKLDSDVVAGDVLASLIPSAYMTHDADNHTTTLLTQNVPAEIEAVTILESSNFFTIPVPATQILKYTGTRSFKALVSYNCSLSRGASTTLTLDLYVQKNGVSPTNKKIKLPVILTSTRIPATVAVTMQIDPDDTITLWGENVGSGQDIKVAGMSVNITFKGWV